MNTTILIVKLIHIIILLAYGPSSRKSVKFYPYNENIRALIFTLALKKSPYITHFYKRFLYVVNFIFVLKIKFYVI